MLSDVRRWILSFLVMALLMYVTLRLLASLTPELIAFAGLCVVTMFGAFIVRRRRSRW